MGENIKKKKQGVEVVSHFDPHSIYQLVAEIHYFVVCQPPINLKKKKKKK